MTPPTLAEVGEQGLVERIRKLVQAQAGPQRHVSLGIGDDAAVLRMPPGEQLVVSSDARVQDVHFRWQSESPRWVGRRAVLAALAGGLQRLPRMIPLKQAMGMILTGRRVGAQEGKELGFVTDVSKHDTLLKTARGWASLILECSPLSIRASKQTAMQSLNVSDLKESMQAGRYPAIGEMARSSDFVEGPKAFAEKRPPRWQGR